MVLTPTPHPDPEPRALPAAAKTSDCELCGEAMVWATTTAGPNGPGGKAIPLNPREDPAGSYAVHHPHRGVLTARPLARDERPDTPTEYRAMPHVATCAARRG